MIWFLIIILWVVAFVFDIWLLPEILIYALAKFAATFFGGVMPEFPWFMVIVASIINAALVLTLGLMATGV